MSVNKVVLLGNVCEDPRIITFEDGGKVANFSLATNQRAFKGRDGRTVKERSDFHNIVLNSRMIEIAEKYIKKGDKLYVEGTLRYRQYTGKEGAKKTNAEVHATVLELLTYHKKGEEQKAGQEAEEIPETVQAAPVDDGLPF